MVWDVRRWGTVSVSTADHGEGIDSLGMWGAFSETKREKGTKHGKLVLWTHTGAREKQMWRNLLCRNWLSHFVER